MITGVRVGHVVALLLCLTVSVSAQTPGSSESRLGSRPGEGRAPSAGTDTPLQGGLGPGFSRAPASITRPSDPTNILAPLPLSPVAAEPGMEMPLYGPLSLPDGVEEGPPDGLTLDAAIDRLVHENLDLRSKFFEIPQAQADILTAGLRANPILFYSTQLIPYGSFSDQRPGGQTQYDINVTFPLDLNQKRKLRTEVACRARNVIEAQYQDAVRLQIANLYTAYVDVLAARETVRYARASLEGLEQVVSATEDLRREGELTQAELDRILIQREAAEVGKLEAEELFRESKQTLGPLLNLSPAQAEALELSGTIYDLAPPPLPIDALIALAMEARPDLAAFRHGIRFAEADVRLAKGERFQDVFLLYQPYTFQNNAPFDARSAHSWGVGLTVPLPIFDRNQGRIQRAQLNVTQTKTEYTTLVQQVVSEVRLAERKYLATRQSVERLDRVLPQAASVRDNAFTRWKGGETSIVDFLNAQRDYNDLVRQYRDTLIRHRRAMLDLNTAVGQRILP